MSIHRISENLINLVTAAADIWQHILSPSLTLTAHCPVTVYTGLSPSALLLSMTSQTWQSLTTVEMSGAQVWGAMVQHHRWVMNRVPSNQGTQSPSSWVQVMTVRHSLHLPVTVTSILIHDTTPSQMSSTHLLCSGGSWNVWHHGQERLMVTGWCHQCLRAERLPLQFATVIQ